ncbi:NAD(+) diphosphatase [Frankia sp. AiPa1]|uniref:NAD(+) diphosphatase n=1 Tax=Frankia sp. AiPa1 TaxID=573492 RepID=UPI0035A94B2B
MARAAPGRFELVRTPTFAGAALERDENLRRDAARQKEGWANARVVVVDEEGHVPVVWPSEDAAADQTAPRLWTRPGLELAGLPPTDAMLLGEAAGTAYWVVRGERARAAASPAVRWPHPHTVGGEFGPLDGALLAAAIGLVNWHARALFCTRDGSPTTPVNAGWGRVCESARHEEYPRTDPAVIVLVHDGGDRVLLGRHQAWPPGRFSVLAGFVEAGESLEACVVREIAEEVGIDVTDVRYLGSQAWPFPRSLMVGFEALADPDQPLRVDEAEISEARWVHRDELRAALARGEWPASSRSRGPSRTTPEDAAAASGRADETAGGEDAAPSLLVPGRISIARNMLDSWAAAG